MHVRHSLTRRYKIGEHRYSIEGRLGVLTGYSQGTHRYKIGEHRYSIEDIRETILRAKLSHTKKGDPRIHFAASVRPPQLQH